MTLGVRDRHEDVADEPAGPGPAIVWGSTGLALVALGVSTFLTIAHYTTADILACPQGAVVNCAKVTSSSEAVLAGVPVAVLGMAWSVAMLGLCVPAAWRSANPLVGLARLALAVGGMGFVVWLIYAELFRIGAVCEWCTVVHVVTFLLFTVVMMAGVPGGVARRR